MLPLKNLGREYVGHARWEYLYVFGRDGLVSLSRSNTYKYIKHHTDVLHNKTYSVSQEDDYFLEWESNQLKKVFFPL